MVSYTVEPLYRYTMLYCYTLLYHDVIPCYTLGADQHLDS